MASDNNGRGSRVGVHRAGQARMSYYVEPEDKALAAIIGEVLEKKNLTETTVECYRRVAMAVGIMDLNGKITPAFENRFALKLYDVKLTK